MNYSVTTVMLPGLDVLETCVLLRDLGFSGVEWRVRHTDEDARRRDYSFWGTHKTDLSPDNLAKRANEVKMLSHEHGLKIVAIASDVKAGDLETIKKLAEGVSLFGTVPIKVSPPKVYTRQARYGDLFQEAVEKYGYSLDVLQPYGIKALVETHNNSITVSASLAHRLVSNFGSERIGVIYDVNNMGSDGYETFQIGVELLGDYLQHCHLAGRRPVRQRRNKNGSVCWEFEICDLADGILNIRQLLEALRSVGYTGFLSIEDFRMGDPETILRTQINYLKSLEVDL